MTEPNSPNLSRTDDEVAGQLAALSARLAELEKKNALPAGEQGVSDETMLKELDFLTGRISELARYIAFGLAALFFLLLSSSSDFAKAMMQHHGKLIMSISFIGCITLLADYVQYQSGRIYVKRVLDQARKGGSRFYDEANLWHRTRQWSSWAKQVLAGVGVVALAGLLLYVYSRDELYTAQSCQEKKIISPTAVTVQTNILSKNNC